MYYIKKYSYLCGQKLTIQEMSKISLIATKNFLSMKGLAIWFLNKVYGIDVEGLRNENRRLKEENGRHVSRYNSQKKDMDSLSDRVARIEKEKD